MKEFFVTLKIVAVIALSVTLAVVLSTGPSDASKQDSLQTTQQANLSDLEVISEGAITIVSRTKVGANGWVSCANLLTDEKGFLWIYGGAVVYSKPPHDRYLPEDVVYIEHRSNGYHIFVSQKMEPPLQSGFTHDEISEGEIYIPIAAIRLKSSMWPRGQFGP